MYWATCGTSSTIRRRVWSGLDELDIGLDDTTLDGAGMPADGHPAGRSAMSTARSDPGPSAVRS